MHKEHAKMKNTTDVEGDVLKALIIDDETDVCYLLSTLLKQKKCITSSVNSLTEATEVLKTMQPDIVFLDNHLPDGMGMHYIQTIREMLPATRIVMITAYDTAADRQQILEKGADAFIGKPFTRKTIFEAVEKLFR